MSLNHSHIRASSPPVRISRPAPALVRHRHPVGGQLLPRAKLDEKGDDVAYRLLGNRSLGLWPARLLPVRLPAVGAVGGKAYPHPAVHRVHVAVGNRKVGRNGPAGRGGLQRLLHGARRRHRLRRGGWTRARTEQDGQDGARGESSVTQGNSPAQVWGDGWRGTTGDEEPTWSAARGRHGGTTALSGTRGTWMRQATPAALRRHPRISL